MDQTSRVKPAPSSAAPAAPTNDRGASDDGMVSLSYILSGVLFYGGLGFAGQHFLGHAWMFPVGLVVGVIASTYLVVKRYSSKEDSSTGAPAGANSKTKNSEKEQ
ncbi:AtpZ/AtpI family protein [Propionibacteriaceae bacterium G1746]